MSCRQNETTTHKFLFFPTVFDLDDGFASAADDFEGEVLHVRLDLGIIELASDETLGVEHAAKEKSA